MAGSTHGQAPFAIADPTPREGTRKLAQRRRERNAPSRNPIFYHEEHEKKPTGKAHAKFRLLCFVLFVPFVVKKSSQK